MDIRTFIAKFEMCTGQWCGSAPIVTAPMLEVHNCYCWHIVHISFE